MFALGALLCRVILAAAFCVILLPQAIAQNRLAELQTQFNREREPVRKAKVLTKLADAQFEVLHKVTDAGDYDQALRIFQDYRDEVRSAEATLKASGVDAERKPGGFKELQMHIRKGLRELDDTIHALPEDQREPFEAVRKDLITTEKELIDMLFPRQPANKPVPDKPKSPDKPEN